ncbi:hypothetical protein [Rouxiella sp. Mn2063]|uniref:hypothetical protein n=1 Tax=Rouxiella sp. Mn2063 TaxID=3395262 RepID=UPI003BDA45E7
MRLTRFTLLSLLSLVLLMIAGWFFYQSYTESIRAERDYECRAFFKLETPELSMPMVATFHVENKKGALWFNGGIYKNGVFVAAVNRLAFFDFDDNCFCSKLHITTLTRFSNDNVTPELANDILPGFLSQQGSVIHFKIQEVDRGIFFMKDNAPMFFCQYI